MSLKAGLYIVATPIGNMEDITLRALSTLKNSSIVICEDTRISAKLLAKHEIKAKLMLYNDHSSAKQREVIADIIEKGEVVSLISDAGTPLISDPGYKLLRYLKSRDIFVDIIPGCSSPIAALAISSLATDKFLFAGFLPKTDQARQKIFRELAKLQATLIFFEAPSRLLDSLEAAYKVLGDREACVARELTKLYQEVKTEKLSKLIEYYKSSTVKGEIVLLISKEQEEINVYDMQETLNSKIADLLEEKYTAKKITDILFLEYSNYFSRNEIYKLVNSAKSNSNN